MLAGSVRLAGNPLPVEEIPNGSEVEVDPGGPAVVRLADGSRAELAAAARAVLHGPVGDVRQVLRLEEGKGTFTAERAARQFRVETPVGRVTVTGTKFSVELRELRAKGDREMKGKLALAMAVTVMAGSVSVEYDGRTKTLTAGESRVFGAEGERPREGGLPEGVRGFSGKVRGVVVAKGDKDTFTFKVGRVLQTWRGSKARRPQALVGQTVKVGPRWHKTDRGWRPVAVHVAFIRKLKPGHEFTIEIANFEGNGFSILELGEEQRKWAMQGSEGEGGERKEGEHKEGERKEGEREGALPAGVIGFSGSVRGVVVAKNEKGFTFKVGRVLRTWEGNKAPRPNDLVGMTLKVGPRWEKKHGKRRPVFAHVVFIHHVVKPGAEMNLDIKHAERDVFMILELSGDQRELVEKVVHEMRKKRHREGEKREGGERDGEKKEGEGGDWDF
ncbi:MAG: FecR domain-containing protein [Planctomycetota bacterium]